MSKRKIDVLFVILSIIIGGIFGFFAEILYNAFFFEFSRVACITIYLALFVFVMGVIILFKSLIAGSFDRFGKVILLTLAATVAFVGCSALFEFIYELGDGIPDSEPVSANQYAFLIDDSDSMTWPEGDPSNQRYTSVQNIINNMEPTRDFAVYSFDSDVRCVTPFGTADSATYKIGEPYYGGGTDLDKAIRKTLDDIAVGNGKTTNIVSLTDAAVDVDESTIQSCISKKVSVSFVVFGTQDTGDAQDIATRTGGTFQFADNVANLDQNLNTVMESYDNGPKIDRDLLGNRRDATHSSFLYALMRIVFLSLLGGLWTIIKLLLIGEKKFMKKSAVVSVVLCVFASVFCELFITLGLAPGILESFVRIIFCALWACTLIPKDLYNPIDLRNTKLISGGTDIGTNTPKSFEEVGKGGGASKSFL